MDINWDDLMNQAKKVQEQMKQSQEKVAQITAKGESGGGMVIAKMNGNLQLLDLVMEPELLTQYDREAIENLIVAAVNDAVQKVRAKIETEVGGGLGGIDLSNFPFGAK